MDLESRNPNAEKNGGIECPTVRWFVLGGIRRQGTLCQPDTGSTGESTSTLGAVLVRERIPWFKFLLMIQKGSEKNLSYTVEHPEFHSPCYADAYASFRAPTFANLTNLTQTNSSNSPCFIKRLKFLFNHFVQHKRKNLHQTPNTKITSATPFLLRRPEEAVGSAGFHRHRALTQLPQNFTQRFRTKTFWKTWWS